MLKSKSAFTLIELMIVIAIIAFLSMIGIPNLMRFLAKSKRAEAYVNLNSLAMAQKAYFAENQTYTTDLNALGWKPSSNINYTYGFSSGEGQSSYIGKLNTPISSLSGSGTSPNGFVICAAGDIDGDGLPDVISINENNEVKIISDDLA